MNLRRLFIYLPDIRPLCLRKTNVGGRIQHALIDLNQINTLQSTAALYRAWEQYRQCQFLYLREHDTGFHAGVWCGVLGR